MGIIKMPKKSNVRANTMPKNPKNDHNQQENSKSSLTPREISDPANKLQKDNLRSSISIQVGVVSNILDDAFKTSDESIIEKIVELTSNRRDILARIIAKNKEAVEQLLRESIMKDGDVVSKESRRGVVKKVGIPLKSFKSELERENQEIVKQVLEKSTVNDKDSLGKANAKKDVRKAPTGPCRRRDATKLLT